MLKLVIGDIENILCIISQHSKDVSIIADKWKLENASELKNLKGDRILSLSIRSSDPYIDVRLGKYQASLNVSDKDTTKAFGIGSKIDSILSHRMSRLRFVVSPGAYLIAFVPLSIGIIMVVYSRQYLPFVTTMALVSLLLSVLVPFADLYCSARRARIYLHGMPPITLFFQRNKDKIIISILTSIVSIICTLLVNWFMRR